MANVEKKKKTQEMMGNNSFWVSVFSGFW